MELEKKVETFQNHVNELEAAVDNSEEEQERYLADYDGYEDILNSAETLLTPLKFHVKYEDERRYEEIKKIEVEKVRSEKLKLETTFETSTTAATNNDETLTSSPRISPPSIKLPKLELLKFNGNILKWQEFWDTYEAMILLCNR